jgi:large subunit ribosomal protein L4
MPTNVNKEDIKKKLTIDVFNTEGEKAGTMTLPSHVFGIPLNRGLLAQAVRVAEANKRAGTHDTKTRSEVIGSTKKISKQKGTGRARHGSVKAPIFVGGGIAHGPKPKDYSLDFPKKMRRLALSSALSDKYNSSLLTVIGSFDKLTGKTREVAKLLTALHLRGKKNVKLLIAYAGDGNLLVRAGRNIETVALMPVSALNAYEIIRTRHCMLTRDAVEWLDKFLSGEKMQPTKETAPTAPKKAKTEALKATKKTAIKPPKTKTTKPAKVTVKKTKPSVRRKKV